MHEIQRLSKPEKVLISNTLYPVNIDLEHVSRRGGIASGEKRRYLAALRLEMLDHLAGFDLATETREEYRRAIRRYVKEERKKKPGV